MCCRYLLSLLACSLLLCVASGSHARTLTGSPEIQSVGPLAFTPDGVLLMADPKQATIFAIQTEDTSGEPSEVNFSVRAIDEKVAALLGTTADDILINDIAVNPASGNVYLSVSRGRGPQAMPLVMRVTGAGEIEEFSLQQVQYSQIALPNPPEDAVRGEGRRRRNSRMESITDLTFLDGQVFIAGLSNEEFASKLRVLDYPFASATAGTSVEIFHGAHGKYETRSPIRTFTPFVIDSEPHLLAAYTCTPLVKFPISMLTSGDKVKGTTIAELGNRNRPLDMIIYQKDGEDYILMANSDRGLMKVSTAGIADIEGITERISGTAGLPYETIAEVEGVVQLDRLNKDQAVILMQTAAERLDLETLDLP